MQEQQVLNQMVALSGKKLEMLTELKKLSEKQRQAFQDNNIAAVEPILNKKDEIIRYVRQLDDAFLKASGTLKEMLGIEKLDDLSKFELAGRNEIKRLIADITDTVESIIKIEQDSHKNVSEMKNEISNRIKSVNDGLKSYQSVKINCRNPSYFRPKVRKSFHVSKQKKNTVHNINQGCKMVFFFDIYCINRLMEWECILLLLRFFSAWSA